MKFGKILLLLSCLLLLLEGCGSLGAQRGEGSLLEKLFVFPVSSSTYLLSCLGEMEDLDREQFAWRYTDAQSELAGDGGLDPLRFVCLSINKHANYTQFKRGRVVFEQYLADHPEEREDMQGFKVLYDRLNEEMIIEKNTCTSLREENEKFKAELESLKIKLAEQQRQIERLKNIEPIIKSREGSNE